MKILFVSPYTPNLIRVRPYQIIRALRRAGHQVTLATLTTTAAEEADVQLLKDLGVELLAFPLSKARSAWNSLAALPGRAPIQANFCWQPALAQALTKAVQVEHFDAIHVEHLRGARYGLHVQSLRLQEKRRRPPLVWDSVDSISHLFAQAAQQSRSHKGRLMTWLELSRTRRHEGWLVRRFDHVLATSATDARVLNELAGLVDKVQVLPNGVDLDYFGPALPASAERSASVGAGGAQKEAPTLVFSGKMSYHANVTAALHLLQDIMPRVWAQRPNMHVQIVGKDPPPALRTFASQCLAQNGAPLVTVTGTVPDLRPYLQQADLAVAPVLYGAGIQNKVLEAMACATPVVTSTQAASGLRSQARDALCVASNADEFAHAIITLLANTPRRQQLGQAGRSYVEKWHSWDAVGAALETVYLQGCRAAE